MLVVYASLINSKLPYWSDRTFPASDRRTQQNCLTLVITGSQCIAWESCSLPIAHSIPPLLSPLSFPLPLLTPSSPIFGECLRPMPLNPVQLPHHTGRRHQLWESGGRTIKQQQTSRLAQGEEKEAPSVCCTYKFSGQQFPCHHARNYTVASFPGCL